MQSLNFGERDGSLSDRVRAIAEVFASGKLGSVASENIVQEMWEKWVFLASLAASTSPDAQRGRQYFGRARRQGFCPGHAR